MTVLEYGPNDRLTLDLYQVQVITVDYRLEPDRTRITRVYLRCKVPGPATAAARGSLRAWASVKFEIPEALVTLCKWDGEPDERA